MEPTPTASKKKVLIIEDDRFFLDLLAKRFTGINFSTLFANNGKIGLDILEKEKPDLILLDVLLPDMNGFDILSQIKSGPHKDTRVIFLSNLGSAEELERAKTLGAYKFMIKATVSLDNIIAEIKACLL